MNALTKAMPRALVGEAALYDERMLSLIRRTFAKDCNADEFDIFIAMCRALKLDPLRKQAYAFIFKKPAQPAKGNYPARPEQRTLTLVTAIQGFRTIADRTGNYRPDEDAAELHYDETLKNKDSNPLGLVKAIVRVFKFSHGAWHRVTSEAYWTEYAPIKEEWAQGEDGRRGPTGRFVLDTSGQWGKMPRLMLAKCAEAAALRKAFPDELSNVHEDAEVDREKWLDLMPAEAVEASETQDRLTRIGGGSGLMIDWLANDMAPIERVSLGAFADRAMEFVETHREEPSQIALWEIRNRAALKEFWAHSPSDALELKKVIETAKLVDVKL